MFISQRLFHIISIITAFCDSFGRCPLVIIRSYMDVILLCIGSKYEVCMFNRIWDMDNCLEKGQRSQKMN